MQGSAGFFRQLQQYILAGLSIDNAPVDLLEKVSVQPHELRIRLEELTRHAGGGVILSTCNRTEILTAAEDVETGLAQSAAIADDIASILEPDVFVATSLMHAVDGSM